MRPQTARILILSADIGEGHVTVARRLTADLRGVDEPTEVELHTDLSVMGRRFGRFMTHGFELHLDQVGWTYELAYQLFFEPAVPRRFGQLALAALGQRGLRRVIASFGPDVIVTEYPLLSAALGELRAMGRLAVPVISSISDPAGLYYWAHPGIDLHLLAWPESMAEVNRIAGPGRAIAVQPLVSPQFTAGISRDEGRALLNVDPVCPVIVVSGGGWGLGDLTGIVQTALGAVPDAAVVALAGRSHSTYEQLSAAFGEEQQVRVMGFTERMPELLAAADLIVHTTGGTTALEARVSGCPLINYGRGVAHVRAHARAMAEHGLAEWAPDRDRLGPAIARALRKGRGEPPDLSGLPDAASVVLGVLR